MKTLIRTSKTLRGSGIRSSCTLEQHARQSLCFALTFALLGTSAHANSSDENKYICFDPTKFTASKQATAGLLNPAIGESTLPKVLARYTAPPSTRLLTPLRR